MTAPFPRLLRLLLPALPVDQAFVLSASATAPDRVKLRWKIAEGYYL